MVDGRWSLVLSIFAIMVMLVADGAWKPTSDSSLKGREVLFGAEVGLLKKRIRTSPCAMRRKK